MQINTVNTSPASKISFSTMIKRKLFYWLRLSNHAVVKTYHGYGTNDHLLLMGHVLTLSPLPRKKYRQNIWTNTFALIRSFMVQGKANMRVRILWDNKLIETRTAPDGFFRFQWHPGRQLSPGIHTVLVQLPDPRGDEYPVIASGVGSVMVSHINRFAFISDIDDTFLISHSSSIFKKLYVLFTKNAHSRKPFEGVVKHYQLLANAATVTSEPNPFFYVSSSEWNLYSFIVEFSGRNQLPRGVFLLSDLKKLFQLFKTGAGKHSAKFIKIVRIMEAYPVQKFVLLGDDSQMDPVIYASVVEHFPGRVQCVYLRHVYEKNIVNVKELIGKIEAAGVPCCHFEHSSQAIEHSLSIGLIDKVAPF